MKKTSLFAKVLACVLTMATILSFASCKDTSWVVKSGEDSVSAGVYLGYLVNAYTNALFEHAYDATTGERKDLFSLEIEEMPAEDFIKQTALESCKQHIALNRLFKEYKLSFTDKELEEMEKDVNESWASDNGYYEENGCGKQSFTEMYKTEKMYEKIFEHYYSENGKEPVSEKERKDYLLKNYSKIKYVSVTYSNHYSGVSTESAASENQKKDLKEIAEKYIERLEKGESIDKIAAEEAAAAHALTHKEGDEHDHDHEATEVTEVEDTFVTKETENPSDFNKAVFDAKYGVPTMTKNSTYGYYIFIRSEIKPDTKDFTDREITILSAMKGEDFEKVIEKAAKEITLTENKAAIKRYKPQNIES